MLRSSISWLKETRYGLIVGLSLVGMLLLLAFMVIKVSPRPIPAPAQTTYAAIVLTQPTTTITGLTGHQKVATATVRLATGTKTRFIVPARAHIGSQVLYWQRHDTGAILLRPFPATYTSNHLIYLLLFLPVIALGSLGGWCFYLARKPVQYASENQYQ